MSNFYYCYDCKRAVDLKGYANGHKNYVTSLHCKECEGLNWKAIIDSPSGETEETRK